MSLNEPVELKRLFEYNFKIDVFLKVIWNIFIMSLFIKECCFYCIIFVYTLYDIFLYI